MRTAWLTTCLTACTWAACAASQAEEALDQVVAEIADYWTEGVAADLPADRVTLPSLDTDGITHAQMLAPQRQPGLRVAQRQQRASASTSDSGLSSVPFMIGDTGAGTCLTIGGPSTFAIEHPTLTCSRLNISENNTPIPTDRSFVSYRHFKNTTGARVLTAFERHYNVDRFTVGTERTFYDGMGSLEVRLPLERRLTSNFSSNVSGGIDFDPTNDVIDPFIGDRQNELGNVAVMLKGLLTEKGDWLFSGGLGMTVPTARDFTYDYHFDLLSLQDFFLPLDGFADTQEFDIEDFGIEITNETVYLSPFLSWLWQPRSHGGRFFHQGFLQVEVAASASRATVAGRGSAQLFDLLGNPIDRFGFLEAVPAEDFVLTPFDGLESADIFSQTLLRLNMGWGYVLSENPRADCLKRLTSLFEVHYTTTLQRPNRTSVPLRLTDGFGIDIPLTPELEEFLGSAFTFGNPLESSNVVNAVAGLTANIGGDGQTVVTSGLIFPLSQGAERAFDLEYNLQVQRLY